MVRWTRSSRAASPRTKKHASPPSAPTPDLSDRVVRRDAQSAEIVVTVAPAGACGHAHEDAVLRRVLRDDGVRSDHGVLADRDRTENLRAGTDDHAVGERRVALSRGVLSPTAQRHTVIEQDVVADLGSLADHDPHTVVDDEPPADPRPRVYLNSRHRTRELRVRTCEKPQPASPQRMRDAMRPDRMEPGVQHPDLERVTCSRISKTRG